MLVIVSSDSALPCSQSTLASDVWYTVFAGGMGTRFLGRAVWHTLAAHVARRAARLEASGAQQQLSWEHSRPTSRTVDAGRDGGEDEDKQKAKPKEGDRRALVVQVQCQWRRDAAGSHLATEHVPWPCE
jgi:hypothetical protein